MTVAPPEQTAPDMRDVTTLICGDLEVVIDPVFGARINSARLGGHDILRPVLDETDPEPLQAASFPLVPFSNRVIDGRFEWGGKVYDLPENWDVEDNAIHGEGWKAPWREVRASDSLCEHVLTGTGWWPWLYECRQVTEIGPDWLRQTLTLTNRGASDMPAGLGFHPYFPRSRQTRLNFEADYVWPPVGAPDFGRQSVTAAFDFSAEKSLGPEDFDHCFEGWKGRALISYPETGLSLVVTGSSHARHCVVYLPDGEPYFCFEPVSHLSGALNGVAGSNSSLTRLRPGESLSFSMQIQAHQAR